MTSKSGAVTATLGRLATLCARHAWPVVAVWLLGLVCVVLLARDNGGRVSIDVASRGSDSARALELASEVLPSGKLQGTATVVMQGRRGTLDDLNIAAQVATMAAEIAKVPGVLLAVDPLNPASSVVVGTDPVSADRRTWITSVVLDESALEPDLAKAQQIIDIARAYDGPDMQVEVAGPGATALNATNVSPGPLVAAAVAAVLILGVTLRSRFAVFVCAAVAGAAAICAVCTTVLLSGLAATSPFSLMLAGIVATATSLGGAVVVVHRMQSSLRRGTAPVKAVSEAASHSGVAVAVGGLGVTVAMALVAAMGLSSYSVVATGAAAAGTTVALMTLTLLPALLALGGPRLLGWAERQHLTTTGEGLRQRPGLRAWWARQVSLMPAATAGAGVLILIAFAALALTVDLGGADDGVDPTSASTRRAYDLISSEYFPGLNGPLIAVFERGDAPTATAATAVTPADVVAAFERTPGVHSASVNVENTDRGVALIRVLPEAGPRSPEAVELLHRLRDDVLPAAVGDSGSRVYVGGRTAIFVDVASDFDGETTLFLVTLALVVAAFSYLVLSSVAVAVAVAATAALSAIAAVGEIVLLFQTESLARSIGLAAGPIEPFVVVLVVVAVACMSPGLSLSLLDRLAEQRDGKDGPDGPDGARRHNRRRRKEVGSVEHGHAEVGHVVLTMNLMTLLVFLAIAAQPSRIMKVIGVGLATGVTLDAFVLRATVLPAALHLLGLRRRARNAVTRIARRRHGGERPQKPTGHYLHRQHRQYSSAHPHPDRPRQPTAGPGALTARPVPAAEPVPAAAAPGRADPTGPTGPTGPLQPGPVQPGPRHAVRATANTRPGRRDRSSVPSAPPS